VMVIIGSACVLYLWPFFNGIFSDNSLNQYIEAKFFLYAGGSS